MKKSGLLIVGVLFMVVCLFLGYTAITHELFDSAEKRGLFGDTYGGLNALFSGLAFSGMVIAIILQKNELTLQREELALARNEFKRMAESQELAQKISLLVERINATKMLIEYGKESLKGYHESHDGSSAEQMQMMITMQATKMGSLTSELEKLSGVVDKKFENRD